MLVAWECKDLEAFAVVLLAQLCELSVLEVGEPSHRRHVDHHRSLQVRHHHAESVVLDPLRIGDRDVPDRLERRLQHLFSFCHASASKLWRQRPC